MIDYAAILRRRYADAEWALSGDDYDGLEWLADSPKPTRAKLDSLWESVQREIADEQTAREAARETAMNKLRALGLTDAEIAALGIR
jgi:hypothetical protein